MSPSWPENQILKVFLQATGWRGDKNAVPSLKTLSDNPTASPIFHSPAVVSDRGLDNVDNSKDPAAPTPQARIMFSTVPE